MTLEFAEEKLIYTRYSYMESLRIEPPASITTLQNFTKDVTLGAGSGGKVQKFTMRKGDSF